MIKDEEKCQQYAETHGSLLHGLIKQPYSCYSIGLAKQGKIILDLNYCEDTAVYADKPIQLLVGSVSKAITGALLLKLLESGVLSLYDSVKTFIPEWKLEDICVYHLLTHTGGFDASSLTVSWPDRGHRSAYYNTIYSDLKPKEVPGTVNRYNTHAYAVLTDILERAVGQSMEQFAQEQLFIPLGMNNTTYLVHTVADQIMYPLDAGSGEPDRQLANRDVTGDTGLCTTSGDLLRFGQMVLEGGSLDGRFVFSERTVALMKQEITGDKFGRTPNFWIKTDSDKHGTTNADFHRCFSDYHSAHTIGHNGFTGCWFFIDPDAATTGAILTNSKGMNLDGRNYKRIGNVLMTLQ